MAQSAPWDLACDFWQHAKQNLGAMGGRWEGDQSGCRVWHLISCLFALERSRGPGSQQVNVPKRNSIMHSPGVPFRRSVLHCRGEQAIAHQDSGRSYMHFSPLPSRLNGLTLSIGGHLCWKRMRQCQT